MKLKEMFSFGASMKTTDPLRFALVEELKDLMSAEHQLLKALPLMSKKAKTRSLKSAFSLHTQETKRQIGRLEEIGKIMEISLSGKSCKAMEGLVAEGQEVMSEHESSPLADALLIGAAQRVEHYEIAAYGTARTMADALGLKKVSRLLNQSIKEEGATDKKLTGISQKDVLPKIEPAKEKPKKAASVKAPVKRRSR